MSCGFGFLSSFYPYVVDTVIEASPDDVLRATQRAVRGIARDTEYFTEEFTMDIVAGQTTYTLQSNYDAKPLRVVTIVVNSVTLGNNDYSITASGRTLTLTNTPSASITDGLVVNVTLLPNLDCMELDEDQMESWAEVVIAGSKLQLYMQPKKPWSDPMEAGMQKGLYEGYIEIMAQDRMTQGQSGSTGVNLGARI